jgi:acyl-CoA oxidase
MQTIKNLGTEKHYKYLLSAAKLEDIGSFSMTELSHGSDV